MRACPPNGYARAKNGNNKIISASTVMSAGNRRVIGTIVAPCKQCAVFDFLPVQNTVGCCARSSQDITCNYAVVS